MAQRKYRDIATFNLRMLPDLRKRLDDVVESTKKEKAKWSLNAEIEQRLEKSFSTHGDISAFSDGELIDELIRRWGREAIQLTIKENSEKD